MAKPRILLLSRRKDLVDALETALRFAELPISVVEGLEEARAAFAAKAPPGALLIDLEALEEDPAALCAAIREAPGGEGAAIVFLGEAGASLASTADALMAGGDAYFALPVEARRVIGKVAAYLGEPVPKVPASLFLGEAPEEEPGLEPTPSPHLAPPREEPAPRSQLAHRVQRLRSRLSQTTLAPPAGHPADPVTTEPIPAEDLAHALRLERALRPNARGPSAVEKAPADEGAEEATVIPPPALGSTLALFPEEGAALVRHGVLSAPEGVAEAAGPDEEDDRRLGKEAARIAELERQKLERQKLEREASEQALLDAERRSRSRTEAELKERLEAERRAREEAEAALRRREEEVARLRARIAFRTGVFDAVTDPDNVAPQSDEVGGLAWPEGKVAALLLGGERFPPASEVPFDPPKAPEEPVPLEPPRGAFADGELPALLWSAHFQGVTGALVLTHADGRTRTLYLEAGEPVGFASTAPKDRPEEALLRAGLITAAKHHELRAGPLASARRLCAALLDEGALKPEELFTAVRGVLSEQVLACLEWDEGSFAFTDERAHAADRVRLTHRFDALLAEGIRRKYDEARLWRVLGGPQTLLGPDDRALRLPPLGPEERALARRFDGARSLEDLVLDSGVAAEVALRTALILVSCGALRVVARGLPKDPAERKAAHERSVAIDRERILDRLHVARHGDYFAFLGVSHDATPFEVHRAAERLKKRFDPKRFGDPAFADLVRALVEICEVAEEAEAVLSDPDLCASYRRNQRPLLEKDPEGHIRRRG